MKRGTKDALVIAIVAVCVAGGWWLLDRAACADRERYVETIEDARRRAFAQGLEEGMKLPPRTASTPELGALILCRQALADAEDLAHACGVSIDAAEARGYARGHDVGYGLGRDEWSVQPWECEGRWLVRR